MIKLRDDEDDYCDPLVEAVREYRKKVLIKKIIFFVTVLTVILGGVMYGTHLESSQQIVEAQQNQ